MDLARIEQLLGREFSQRDENFLAYSIPREDIMIRMRNRTRPYHLIIAPRGSGKSGLLLMLEDELRQLSGSSSVIIKKYYEDVSFPTGPLSVDVSLRYWTTTFMEWILAEIGMKIDVPRTSDEVAAVDLAERSGRRERKIGHMVHQRSQEGFEHLRFITQRLIDKSEKAYWLLLDEMDDFYSNTEDRNNALVGMLQACDAVTKLSANIFVRITMRPHIHTYLKTKFDVVQKFRDAELPIFWDEVQLRDILVRRIEHFDGRIGRRQPEFELSTPALDRGVENRNACRVISRYLADFDSGFKADSSSDYRALQTLSLRRPRWMIEYCWIALRDSNNDFADAASFNRAMHEFGRNRIDFLAGEHSSHLPEFLTWVNGLGAARRRGFGTSEQFRDLVVEYIVRTDGVSIAERSISLAESAQALRIAQALFMLEVVRAHQSVGGAKDDHRFYTYSDAPELLTSWNNRANTTWELHETFARALNIIDNGTYRVGGEVRRFGDRRSGGAMKRHNRPGSSSRRRAAQDVLHAQAPDRSLPGSDRDQS